MDYESFDSSGTDDDLPPTHQNRISRGGGGHAAGNGRPAVVGSGPYNRICNEADMETQIHLLEQEAYCSLLIAFKAQADAITWEKESLMTELRKELRLSNEEHREILSRVKADDLIRRIREWRQLSGLQAGTLTSGQVAAHEPIPSPTISASRKKQKMTQAMTSQSFGAPNPSFHPPTFAPSNPPPSSVPRRGPLVGPKGKKHKLLPPSNPSGRGQTAVNRVGSTIHASERAETTKFDPLIGRKVRTRWPDDNNFYEAVITDYNPAEGRHALVYDIHTANETWEWVNLSEISPGDIQWEGDDPGISSQQGCYGGPGGGRNRESGHDGLPTGGGRGRGIHKGHFKKEFPPSQNGIGKKASDNIQILHTDTLIEEVERVFGSSHPDPTQVEKAKKLLMEQEQSLVDAIQRLVDISEDR